MTRIHPPNSEPFPFEAEQGVLGGLLLDNGALARIDPPLEPSQFDGPQHGEIYCAIRSLLNDEQPADVITVMTRLEQANGGIDHADTFQYLNALRQSVPSASNIRTYADIVRERAGKRAEKRVMTEAAATFTSATSAVEALEQVQHIVEQLKLPARDSEQVWLLPPPISEEEMRDARLHPRCIVENYLYADVGELVAPGSTGKTTFGLYEKVCIALGRPMLGLKVHTPGPCLLITGEDRREFLVGRLREVCGAMGLTRAEMRRVLELVRIDDRTREVRKLAMVLNDVVMAAPFADALARGAKDFAPVLVQFDPLVSFGVGERLVNDGLQGIVEAGRVITGALDCCTEFVHHTSQDAFRQKIIDMYAGRSGTAMPDGCRIVSVMETLDDGRLFKATGEHLINWQSAFALHRPKVSYAPPNQPPLYVRRDGFSYELLRVLNVPTDEERQRTLGEQLGRFIASELHEGHRHSRKTLEALKPGMSRDEVRVALAWLQSHHRLTEAQIIDPATGKTPSHGQRSYLVARDPSRENPP